MPPEEKTVHSSSEGVGCCRGSRSSTAAAVSRSALGAALPCASVTEAAAPLPVTVAPSGASAKASVSSPRAEQRQVMLSVSASAGARGRVSSACTEAKGGGGAVLPRVRVARAVAHSSARAMGGPA